VTVKKLSTAILLGMSFTTTDDRYDSTFLNNFVTINVLDRIASLPGVGDARLASRQDYGMRVWVNPSKMATLGVTATDIMWRDLTAFKHRTCLPVTNLAS